MPLNIEFTTQLEQANRAANVTGPGFFYLASGQDIDFSVKGLVNDSWSGSIDNSYGTKYVITDVTQWTSAGGPSISGLDDGDIVIKRETTWEIYIDVSSDRVKGPIVYNEYDGKLWVYNQTGAKLKWEVVGSGAGGGGGTTPGGSQWSIQFQDNNGFSGSDNFEFDANNKRVNLGPGTVIAFGDGTTQGTARVFYGSYGPTNDFYPVGFSGQGYTGDRLLVATGPSADPFRNYVRFGSQWFQYGVAGIASGPRGLPGQDGSVGSTGATGATGIAGSTGATGVGLTGVGLSGDYLVAQYLFANGTTSEFIVGYVRGNTGATGVTGTAGATGATGYVNGIQWQYYGEIGSGQLVTENADDTKLIAFLTGNPSLMFVNKRSVSSIDHSSWISSWDDSTSTGTKGYLILNRRESGLTGDIIFDVSSVASPDVTYTNFYQVSGSIRGGSTTNIPASAFVSVNFIPAGNRGEIGATGFTGATGERGTTGNGVTGFAVVGDDLYYWLMGPTGATFGTYQNAGNVRGPQGNPGTNGTNGVDGATGATGVGLTGVGLSGDFLVAQYLFPSGATSEFIIGNVRGPTGASFAFEPDNSELARTTTTVATTFGAGLTARKLLFLLEDGSVTADYLLNHNIFSANDFLFSISNFARTPNAIGTTGAAIRRLSNNLYSLGGPQGVTFTASYVGSPVTASIVINPTNEGQNFPIFFPTAAMDTLPGVNHTLQITGIGGSNRQLDIRLSVTGTNFGNTRNRTSDITIKLRNDFLYGATGASALDTTSLAGMQWNKDYFSTKPEAESIDGYSWLWTGTGGDNPYYGYFAYPLRIHNEAANNAGVVFTNTPVGGSSFSGGWSVQGYGLAADAAGLSHINYTNSEGYIEKYIVWRTNQSGIGRVQTTTAEA